MIYVSFTIPTNPVTKKNSHQIYYNKTTGRRIIAPSKAYGEYEKKAMGYIRPVWLLGLRKEPISVPVNVKCTFYMGTRRKVDLSNLLEAIDDVMVKGGILADDNFTIVAGHDGSRVFYDKENPRTEVEITDLIK